MAEKVFPDIANKLNAPVRKTAFERQKEEAEAKRKREADETAALLKGFQEHFADGIDEPSDAYSSHGGGTMSGMRGGPRGAGTRPFMGSGPGVLRPPPFQGKKRGHDGSFAGPQKEKAMFAYNDGQSALQNESDDDVDPAEAESAAPKQTVQLSDLPVGTTKDEVFALLQEHAPKLKIERVEIQKVPGTHSGVRTSLSAIATLADGISNREIDSAITTLQRLYLGLGHRLAISRHVSSTIAAATITRTTQNDSLPFGAKVLDLGNQPSKVRYNMAAPPSDFGSAPNRYQQDKDMPSTVFVKVPTDLKQLKLINKTIEGLIKIGPEFEAALMQRPEVRSEEKWAWLFDPSSTGGVYFRWRLWYLTSGRFAEKEEKRNEAGTQAPEVIFRDEAPWQAPDRRPRFERVTRLDEFLSDPEYDEEEEEYSDNEESKKAPELNLTGEASEAQYLNPLHRARLTHLLARLPTSPANLRRGDVARISAFAYRHAGHGAEEVASMLAANVAQPLSLSDANPNNSPLEVVEYVEDYSSEDEDNVLDYEPPEEILPSTEMGTSDSRSMQGAGLISQDVKMDDVLDGEQDQGKEDTSSAKLIGLYVISDVLHGCDTAGVRNTWKYKALIEKAFKEQQVFEQLGRLERDMQWGKVKADRWRSRVTNLLDIWSGWSLYSPDTISGFVDTFKNPPLTEEEKAMAEKEKKEREERRNAQKWKAPKFQHSSEPPKSEEPAAAEGLSPGEPPVGDDEEGEAGVMDIDAQMDGAADWKPEVNDDLDEKGMFSLDGASNERRPSIVQGKQSGFSLAGPKALVSKGKQRPSTRMMLDD